MIVGNGAGQRECAVKAQDVERVRIPSGKD